jgi:hypothetical protein
MNIYSICHGAEQRAAYEYIEKLARQPNRYALDPSPE